MSPKRKTTKGNGSVMVPVDRRQWRGLQREAQFLNETFGLDFTAEELLHTAISNELLPTRGQKTDA